MKQRAESKLNIKRGKRGMVMTWMSRKKRK